MNSLRRCLPVMLLLVTSIVQAVEVRDVRPWRAPDHTRIVFDLTAPAEHKLMVLENPDRIVVDVTDTALKSSLSDLKLDLLPFVKRCIATCLNL